MNQRNTLKINSEGHLEIGGCDAEELARRFGTPLYVFDEAYIREMMRTYKKSLEENYGGYGVVLYASKAFSCKAIYKIARSEGIGADVVSGGELYTALSAGFPADRICMHGNNKTPDELNYAVDSGVDVIVVDSELEADRLDALCEKKGVKQSVLIRINPGVEAHTHAYVQTATPDSKFGFSIANGTAKEMTAYVLGKRHLVLKGFHCHIGSQIFEKQSFVIAAEKMTDFIAKIKAECGFEAGMLNIGGGFGIYYTDEDPKLACSDYAGYLKALCDTVSDRAEKLGIAKPFLAIEPGRSIVGEAGVTLYTAGAVKNIPGIKTYIAVDGGMFENPRYALYQSKYTVVAAGKMNAPCTQKATIAGKCCESGDIIAVNVALPEIESGDVLAVLSTGAYNYSMASNYNRNFVPAAVLVRDGNADVIIKKQTYEDLVRNDVVPQRLK